MINKQQTIGDLKKKSNHLEIKVREKQGKGAEDWSLLSSLYLKLSFHFKKTSEQME